MSDDKKEERKAERYESVSVGIGSHEADGAVCITISHNKAGRQTTMFLRPAAARALFQSGLLLCDVVEE